MKKKIIFLLIASTMLLGGCVKNKPRPMAGLAPATIPTTPPPAPQGMAIGQFYVSALNESCYELIPVNYSDVPQAICQRGTGWEVISSVLAQTPRTLPSAP